MIHEILKVTKREFDWMLVEKKYVILALVGPIIFALAIDLMYLHKKVVALPVVIVDQDHSALSRDMTRAVLASETFRLAGFLNSAEDFPRLIAEDKARVCIVFPYGMERNLKAGRGGRVEVLVDQSNYLAGRVEMGSALEVFTPYSVGANVLGIEARRGVPPALALRQAMPLDTSSRMLFNPAFTSNYLNFVALGTAYIGLQLGALIIAIRSGSSEYGNRQFQPLAGFTRNPAILAVGKVLAYLSVYVPVFLFVVIMPHLLFGAPFVRTGISFWVVAIWFPATLITFSYGLSAVMRDPIFASEICTIVTLPNFLISGYTWPVTSFPTVLLPFKFILPMASVAFMMKKITLMGGTLADCWIQIPTLAGWSLVAVILAGLGTRRILRHVERGETIG